MKETLRAFGQLEIATETNLEIVVVDNASVDDTSAVVHDFSDESAATVRYIHEPRPGLSVARNRGMAVARGRLLLFTDDDCLPAPGWISAALRRLEDNPCQIVGGRVELRDPGAAPVTIKTSQVAERLTSPYDLDGFLHGCNMAFGRAVIETVGTFDARFGAGSRLTSAEDTDLVYRAFRAGVGVLYDPDMVVYHDHGRRPDQVYKLLNGYRLGLGGLAMKHFLEGDTDPAKSCYWKLRAALRDFVQRRAGLTHVRTESRIMLGALKFAVGAVLDRTRPAFSKDRLTSRDGSRSDRIGSTAAK